MSHIGLLMTGVLTTGQPSLPKLPVQPLFQLDNPVPQSEEEPSNEVVPATEITPPEFIQLDSNLLFAYSDLNEEQQSRLSNITAINNLMPSNFYYVKKDTDEQNWTLGEISVVAAVNSLVREKIPVSSFSDEQSSDESVIARSRSRSVSVRRSVSKGESPKLRPKFINQNLPTLGFGSSGISVKVLQRLLLSNGYAVRVDGAFGALTESAVKAFQNRRYLGVDGVVGYRTWRELTK
jgi:peptidoglycan hydrolase-like protein with peptidoglycan-binding domain